VLDYATWPCDRRRLVDELWALGLANLPALPAHDIAAARAARLAGRNLEPWRAVLAVAHWLQEEHGVRELFTRLEQLSQDYQKEREDFDRNNPARLLALALLELSAGLEGSARKYIQEMEIGYCYIRACGLRAAAGEERHQENHGVDQGVYQAGQPELAWIPMQPHRPNKTGPW
jgi:hypothetical protein